MKHLVWLLLLAGVVYAEQVDPDRFKPAQQVSTGTPPLSPAVFDPDPNRLAWPPNDLNEAVTRWEVRRETVPAAKPFNPDPGASLKEPPRRTVLDTNFGNLPDYGTEPVVLPDGPLRRARLELTLSTPGDFGGEPVPAPLALPREQARKNLPLELKFHTPHYPKFEKTWP